MACVTFDIETTGLNPLQDRMTCIAVFGNGVDACFTAVEGNWEEALRYLDEAQVLGAFNGARFDLHFMQVIHLESFLKKNNENASRFPLA